MKAPHNGTYTVDGSYFRMREGDVLPDNAVVVAKADELYTVPEETLVTPHTGLSEAKAAPEPENKAEKAPAKKKA